MKELQEQEKNLREAMKEEQRIMREQKEKEEKDKEFRKGLLKEFDYTEEQLDDILHSRERERKRETESIEQTNRTTYIRVGRNLPPHERRLTQHRVLGPREASPPSNSNCLPPTMGMG